MAELTDVQKKLVQAMMGYGGKTRGAWASRMGGIPGAERLTDRDWALVEWLSDQKGEVPHSEAVKYLAGKADSGDSGEQEKREKAVTQAISRLRKDLGVLRTPRTKEDERRKTVALTAKGERFMEQRRAIREQMYQLIFESWGNPDDQLCKRMTELFLLGIRNADKVFGNET